MVGTNLTFQNGICKMDTQIVKSFLQAANLSDIDIEALLEKKASNITSPSVVKRSLSSKAITFLSTAK